MNKILPEHSATEVNKLLMGKWEISLFKFAQVFAVCPVEQLLQRTEYPFSYQEISAIKRNLNKMRADLLKRGRFILNITNRLSPPPIKSISDDELIKHMRLERFFKEYIHRLEIGVRYIETICLFGKRGREMNKKTIIALGWGNLVSERRRRIDWEMLGDLYEWFWERLSPYEFYNKLKPSSGIAEDLRALYNRHRWVGGAKNYVNEHMKIRKNEIFQFWSNFILQKFVGGKEDYLTSKLPLTWTEFPKFFMNIMIDAYLGTREGLTLFSKDQSLADPLFLFTYIWLEMEGKSIYPELGGKIPFGIKLSPDAEMPYQRSDIGDYFNYAIKLFLEHKVDLMNPPPLIIFPDKSPFSTAF